MSTGHHIRTSHRKNVQRSHHASQPESLSASPSESLAALEHTEQPVQEKDVLLLQRTIGNRAVGQLLANRHAPTGSIQRALSPEQVTEFETVVNAINANPHKEWADAPELTNVLAELKKLVTDDPTILPVLTEAFVTRAVPLIKSDDPGAGKYDYSGNTLTIFQQTPRNMADTIVFEIGNAVRREKFQKSDESLKKRETGGFVSKGEQVSDIEAETTLDYLDHVLNMIANGKTLVQLPTGAKAIYKSFMEKHPDYFNMDKKRQTEFREAYKTEMRNSPHDAKAAEGTRMHLDTKDLYSYERITDGLQLSGVIALVKESTEKNSYGGRKFKPNEWGGVVNDIPLKPPMKRTTTGVPELARGKFYMVMIDRVERYYAVDLSYLKLNEDQAAVAENEWGQTAWDENSGFEAPGDQWAAPAKAPVVQPL